MKPILVKNQSEWERLAPVLEALGYVWRGNECIASFFNPLWESMPSIPVTIYIERKKLSYNYNKKRNSTQSVDEYLQANNLKFNELQKVDDINVADLKTDYKSKYETLLQGVKDAIDEMDKEAEINRQKMYRNHDNDFDLIAGGINQAIKILTEKTGIQP